MRTLEILVATALLATLGVGALAAQEEQQQQQPQMRMRMHAPGAMRGAGPMHAAAGGMLAGMAGMGQFSPATLMRHKDFLDLTDEQVGQLEQLQQAVREAHEQAQQAAQEHVDALREAWQADRPDVDAIRQQADALNQVHHRAQVAALTAAARAKAVLTPEQQGKLQGWMAGRRAGAMMRGMQRGRRPGMMRMRPRTRMPMGRGIGR